MKIAALLAVASVLLASGAVAQTPAPIAVPPPPGLHDPGVRSVAPAGTAGNDGARPLPPIHDPQVAGDGKHMSLPQVSVRQEGDNQVQEYRRSGLLYMVVVTPKSGIPQTYMVDPDGTRHLQPGEAPVRPVMYKVLEWGKSRPASATSGAAAADGGH